MAKNNKYKVGTLFEDMGKMAMISRIIDHGKLESASPLINLRTNYEIYYLNGTVMIMGAKFFKKLVREEKVKILHNPEL